MLKTYDWKNEQSFLLSKTECRSTAHFDEMFQCYTLLLANDPDFPLSLGKIYHP